MDLVGQLCAMTSRKSSAYYILDGKKVVPTDDIKAWSEMFGKAHRVVARTSIGKVDISTVFLGIDHGLGDGPPLLFETMVFGGPLNEYMDRCSTWEEAERMHTAFCVMVKLEEKK